MPTGKNMHGDKSYFMDAAENGISGKLNTLRTTETQLFRLIENDEGVPFQLTIGGEPGEGCYHFVGNGIRNLTGIDPYAFTESTFMEMIEEAVPLTGSLTSDISELRKMLINGEIQDYRIEIRIKTSNGETKWLRETAMPVRDEETGNVNGIIGILHDVSERRRVLARLDEAREKAVESEKLKTSFLQNLSHEVRTPLNAIVGFSTLLCEPDEEYSRKKEFLSMINSNTDHFLELMENIIEVARIEAGSSSVASAEVNIKNMMNRLYKVFCSRAEEKKIRFICSIPEESGIIIRTDSFKLFQVLNHIIGNAIKFTHSGTVEFGFILKEDKVEFFVTDTGPGIPDNHKQMVFEKFYQVDSGSTRQYTGIGLGLTIARAYVEMLGGSIWCVSQADEGSTFRFRLPR